MNYATMPTKGEGILLIDDDPLLRESFTAFLEDAGFSIREAGNGQQGLEMIRQYAPALVICDLQMPIMNGLEFLVALQKEVCDIPVIVVSGAGVIEDAVRALKLGAWDYLIKPIVDMATLSHAITRALERVHLLAENKTTREQLEKTNQTLTENLAILKADQQAGRTIQQQLLPPKTVQFDHYTFRHQLIPSLYLSGDFVDYFKIDDAHLGFYLADVSGHGVSSAFVTVFLKCTMAQWLADDRQDGAVLLRHPEQVLQQLNEALFKAHFGKHLTIFYGTINVRTHQMRYAMAGQFPHPFYIVDGNVTCLSGKGIPLGLTPAPQYAVQMQTFAPDAKLILFSDGILEMLPNNLTTDKESYVRTLLEASAPTAFSTLLKPFMKDTALAIPDDMTALMVSRHDT